MVSAVAYFVVSKEEEGIAVEISPAVQRPIFRSFVNASGEIIAARYADIGTSIMGKIVSLPVREGQTVRKGQLLAKIDPVQAEAEFEAARKQVTTFEAEVEIAQRQIDPLHSQLNRARAVAREAELTLSRVKQLFEKGVVSAAELDQAEASYATTQADVRTSEAEIERAEQTVFAARRRVDQASTQVTSAQDIFSKTEILSPMAGIISKTSGSGG